MNVLEFFYIFFLLAIGRLKSNRSSMNIVILRHEHIFMRRKRHEHLQYITAEVYSIINTKSSSLVWTIMLCASL